MSSVSYWITPYAKHQIPESIMRLAEAAERKATQRHMWRLDLPQGWSKALGIEETAYFKVIAEWGAWREEQDRIEYLMEVAR